MKNRADLSNAVNGMMAGIFATGGQSCMAGSRVLAQAPVHRRQLHHWRAELRRWSAERHCLIADVAS
jgi:acyl-CoA reductase-like NAD-dependent aldehyde dehydrogenase